MKERYQTYNEANPKKRGRRQHCPNLMVWVSTEKKIPTEGAGDEGLTLSVQSKRIEVKNSIYNTCCPHTENPVSPYSLQEDLLPHRLVLVYIGMRYSAWGPRN